ncbi:MAG: hypothetical protein R3F43_08225 [bacterium]
MVANFRGARFEGYACRQIRGSSGMSVHGTGRALDIFVPLSGGAADNDLGDPIANWLVEHAEIGVQLIWDRTIWSGSRSPAIGSTPASTPPRSPACGADAGRVAARDRSSPAAARPPDDGGGAGRRAGRLRQRHPRPPGRPWDVRADQLRALRRDLPVVALRRRRLDLRGRPGTAASRPRRLRRRTRSSGLHQPLGGRGGAPDGDCACRWTATPAAAPASGRCDDGGWTCMGGGTCDAPHAAAACDAAPAPPADPPPPPPARRAAAPHRWAAPSPDGDRVRWRTTPAGAPAAGAVCDDGDWVCRQEAGPAPIGRSVPGRAGR